MTYKRPPKPKRDRCPACWRAENGHHYIILHHGRCWLCERKRNEKLEELIALHEKDRYDERP